MSIKKRGSCMRAAIVVAALAALWVAGSAAAATPPQTLSVVAHTHSITAPGANTLRPGLVTLHIRDAGSIPHGVGIIALEGTTAAKAAKIVGGDNIPDTLPFALLGGVPELQPGGTWTGTVRLDPGKYLLFDDGANGKGMRLTFTVGGAAKPAAPPKVVGTVTMTDFAFGLDLPHNWNGTGTLKVPNVGKEIHELTFVTAKPAELAALRKQLSKGYPKAPPRDARIVYAVGGMSPGETSYVRVHLPPGTYLAICLFPDSKTGKPHTALGMMSTVTVHGKDGR
jgi:hypothetical protein